MSRKKIFGIIAALAAVLLAFLWAYSQRMNSQGLAQRLVTAIDKDLKSASPGRGGITGLAYDEENNRLLVAWTDGYFEMWDAAEGSKRRLNAWQEREADRALAAGSLRFTRDGQRFFTNSPIKGVQLWGVKTGALLHTMSESEPFMFQGPATYAGAGDLYLLLGMSGMQFFDGQKKTLHPAAPDIGASMPAVAAHPQSGLVAISATDAIFQPEAAHHLRLFKLTADDGPPRLTPVKEITFNNGAGGYILAAAFAPDGQSLYTVSTSGLVEEWSTPALELIETRSLELKGVYEAEFRPERGLLAVAGYVGLNRVDGDHLVKVISLDSGQAVTAPAASIETRIEFIPKIDRVLAIHGRRASLIDTPR